ncbi:hypothetical protein OKS68_10000 [Aeromonas veronii]|uniref:hypothetical protein n=1 Tax=Aeromonas veronii TaxID=654 RepID=UPI00226D09C8|nr:hypothetical protein [Aeromonas veronii]MCX9132800.1 hypothetical protein [Aeromonas veronii]
MALNTFYFFIFLFAFFYRYKKNNGAALINPILYLVSFSFAYLIVPIFVIYGVGLNNKMLNYSEYSDIINCVISTYFFIVFVFFYLLSKDPLVSFKLEAESHSSILPYVIATILSFYFILISISYGSELSGIYLRSDKYIFFSSVILNEHPKVLLLSKVLGVLLAFLCLRYRHFFVALLLSSPVIYFDFIIKGRSMTLYVLLPSILIFCFYYYKYFIYVLMSVFILLGCLSLFRETSYGSSFFTVFGEFFATRESTSYLIDIDAHSNMIQLLSNIIFSLFPSFVGNIFNPNAFTSYTKELEALINNDTIGFSGNIVGESYYYGEGLFSAFAPFCIGWIYFVISQIRLINYYRFLLVIMLCSYTIWFLRSEFFVTFGALIFMLLVYVYPILFISDRFKIFPSRKVIDKI